MCTQEAILKYALRRCTCCCVALVRKKPWASRNVVSLLRRGADGDTRKARKLEILNDFRRSREGGGEETKAEERARMRGMGRRKREIIASLR